MNLHKYILMILLTVVACSPLLGASKRFVFDNAAQEHEFERLNRELRCVTCPNQTIADSQAPIAKAMQEEIYRRLKQGESADSIRLFLKSRYGDEVSYLPVIKKETTLLWIGPIAMLVFGVLVWMKRQC